MSRWIVGLVLALAVGVPSTMEAQTGDGSVRGFVKDEQGAVLPGVTVTATSPALLTPVTGVTDASGYYRLLNLPPGTYACHGRAGGLLDLPARRAGHARRPHAHRRLRACDRQPRRDDHGLRRLADDRDRTGRRA